MLPYNTEGELTELKPEKLGGLLWKKSPSPYKFGLHQRRYVELVCGRLSWSLIDGDDKKGQEKGFLDFTGNSCTVEPVDGSDVKFVLKPSGDCWGIGSSFTGNNGGNRVFQFDASDSEHARHRWIRAIQAHMAWAEARLEPVSALKGRSSKKKKAKRAKLAFEDETEEVDAASDATNGPKRNIRERINTGFEFDEPKEERKLGFQDEADEVDAASEATGGPKRNVRDRINTGFEREEKKAERRPMVFSDNVEELDAASESTSGLKRDARDRVNTGFERGASTPDRSERQPMKFDDDVQVLDAASEAPEGPRRSVRTRINTGFEMNTLEEEKAERKPMMFSEDVEELEAASEAPTGPKRSVRDRINTGVSNKADVDDESTPEGGAGRAISFGQADEVEAASEASSGRSRSVRQRVNTGFSKGDDATQDDDEDLALQEPMDLRQSLERRSSLLDKRLSSQRGLRRSSISGRRSSLGQSNRAQQKREFQHAVVGVNLAALPDDSPEAMLDEKLVEDAEKDAALLQKSLSGLVLFEAAEEQAIKDLIQAMSVFAFKDKEEVVRQGDLGGTHFFVVAEGEFEIVKDGTGVDSIQAGVTFGESVLLIDGQRNATVRAKGEAKVYGMEADDVRDVLRFQYEMEHKEVMVAVDKIIESENCEQIHKKLNAFQLHELYNNSEVKTFESGQSIFTQGQEQLREVYVLVQGAVVLRKDDVDLQRVHLYKMIGIEGLLYGVLEMSAVVDGMAKVLVVDRQVLERVFGTEQMPAALLKAAVRECLGQVEELNCLHDEQRAALAGAFRIRKLEPGEELNTTGVRFAMAMHHDIEVSTDGFTTDVKKLVSISHEYVGKEQLLNAELAWSMQVRSLKDNLNSWVAVWYADDVTAALARDETKDKLSILRMVLLFRTLPFQSLQHLAQNMQTQSFQRNEAVFKQGDMGDSFYIVGSGRVHIERSGRYIRGLAQGDYFGERALLTREPRSASIIASENCNVWKITQESFNEVMPSAMIDYLKVRSTLQDKEFSLDDLMVSKTVGSGGFGTVKMVHAKDGSRYALKCVRKQLLVQHGQKETLINEREILAEIDHPFIVKLVQSFRNEAFVYLLMELVSGGELLEALTQLGILNNIQAQFFTASVLLALQHLHERRIAYLDLKSENVLLDHQGYIKIVDFGLAVKIKGGQGHAVKGTPHFMAPEMILSKGYDTTADLWSLGICLYEFMVGELPFGHGITSKSDIFKAILKAELVFPEAFQKQPWYEDSASLIESLLQRKPTKRLGGGIEGYAGLFAHAFFNGFDWDGLMNRKLTPPYVPKRELYAEQKGTMSRTESSNKRSLADVEKEAVAQELKDGWKDPEPGWDDDFES